MRPPPPRAYTHPRDKQPLVIPNGVTARLFFASRSSGYAVTQSRNLSVSALSPFRLYGRQLATLQTPVAGCKVATRRFHFYIPFPEPIRTPLFETSTNK